MDSRLNREVLVVFVGHLLAYAAIYLFADKAPLPIGVLALVLALLTGYLWYRERRARLACAPFSEQIIHSPYEFEELTKAAESSLFAVGPSLKYIAMEKKTKDAVFAKCGKDSFKLRVLISNPEEQSICNVLEQVSFTPGFKKDLAEASAVFQGWKEDASKGRPIPLNIRIKKTDVVTMSLFAVDAERPEGFPLSVTAPVGRRLDR